MRTLALEARSLDHRARAALRPGAALAVHSVFPRAINLLDAAGQLIGLVGPDGGNGPGLLVLAGPLPDGLASAGLVRGQRAAVDGRRTLHIGMALEIATADAELWVRPPPPTRTPDELLLRNVGFAARAALRRRRDGLGGLLPHLDALLRGESPPQALPPLLRVSWAALRRLLDRWPEALPEESLGLIGLGPGQTPAGDDLLAGLVVASLRLGSNPAVTRASGRALVAAARGRTTDLGYARLCYAAEGELDERSERALAALAGDDARALEVAVDRLIAYGHSSGLDTLVGLLIGCAIARRSDGPGARPVQPQTQTPRSR